jgi:hypothetical protein
MIKDATKADFALKMTRWIAFPKRVCLGKINQSTRPSTAVTAAKKTTTAALVSACIQIQIIAVRSYPLISKPVCACSLAEDSVNSSTMTRQISNAAAVVRKGHPLAFIQEVSLSVDGAEAENSHPLCCDDSPSCSSDYQIQSPSLHTLLDTGGATPNGDPGKNPSKALFQRYPFFTTPPPRKSNLSSSSTKEEEQESPSMANTLDAAHRRTTTAESPPSWSRRTLFFHRRRPATPPKRSSKSSHSTSSMRSLPLKDVTTPSRNSYPLQAVSPAYAMHPRTNHKKEPPETTPK